MGFKVKVTNNGKVDLGRDNKLFTASRPAAPEQLISRVSPA